MRVFLAAALLLTSVLAGCASGNKDANANDAPDDLSLSSVPVLFLNVTIGNETFRFSSAAAPSPAGAAGQAGASSTTSASGNSTSKSNSTAPKGNSTAPKGNATGNATAAKPNATGNAATPSGLAPLNVSVTLGAKGLPAGKAVGWTLDFGDLASKAGNATKAAGNSTGNATGNATKGNGTAKAEGPANGTKVPATLTHTYKAAGIHNVTFTLKVANGTAQVLRAMVTVEAPNLGNATNGTAGPVPETIVIEGIISGIDSEPSGNNDETFDLLVPVTTMTITMEFEEVACAAITCAQDLDWSITGPGGEEASGASAGNEDPATFELPTLGTWTVTVVPFVAMDTSYTITVTFT